jgi:hypothetical protein
MAKTAATRVGTVVYSPGLEGTEVAEHTEKQTRGPAVSGEFLALRGRVGWPRQRSSERC